MSADGLPLGRGAGHEIGDRARRLLRIRFFLILLMLAAMSAIAFIVFHLLVRGQDEGAVLLDISGRQRVLIERIAADTLRLVEAPVDGRTDLRADLQASARLLAQAHLQLDASMPNVSALMRMEQIAILEPYLHSQLNQFGEAVQALVRLPDNALTVDHPLVKKIEGMAAGSLSAGADALVSLLAEGMRTRVGDLHTFAAAGETLFLLLLGVMAWRVFGPMLRNTEVAFEQLAALENYHRSVVDALADGILVIEPHQRLIEAMNPAAQAIFHLAEGIGVGQPLDVLLPATGGYSVPQLRRWHRHHVKGQGHDGSPFHLEVTVREAPVDGRDRVIAVVCDITRQVEAEAKAYTLNDALEQSAASVIITDTDGVILYANPRASQVSGYGREELMGRSPNLLKSGRTPPAVYAELWARLKAGQTWKGELLNRRKNGELYWESLVVSPLRNIHGEVTQYLAVTEDVTERKEMEEALVVAKRQAEKASRTKSDFLASMSHELRTPLNAIIGYSEFIGGEPFGPVGHEKYKEYLSHIHESGHHLLALINDMLDLSKIEAGKLALEEEEVDLGGTIELAIRLVAELAARRGVSLTSAGASSLPRLRADPLRLRQVLLNLLTNAIKFTGAGGQVELRASQDAAGGVVIAVRDTGIGMSPEDIEKALEPFGQVANPMVRRDEGTGLGLPITKRLVELHGGKLELESAPGVGTTVTVRLPAERVCSAAGESAKIV